MIGKANIWPRLYQKGLGNHEDGERDISRWFIFSDYSKSISASLNLPSSRLYAEIETSLVLEGGKS